MHHRLRRWLPTRDSIVGNRWLRWLGPSLLHPRLWHFSRRGVAAGAAIGVFFAFITPVAQIPLSAAVSVMLRCNVAAAAVATLINTPPTFGPVYYGAWKLGSWVLGEPTEDHRRPAVLDEAGGTTTPPAAAQGFWRASWARLQQVGKPLLLGAALLGSGGAALAYASVNAAWHLRVRLKRQRRLRRAAGGG